MKTYLGDGVYVDFTGWAIVLTTSDGVRETNRIVLEPRVIQSLGWAIVLTTSDGVRETNRIVLEPRVIQSLLTFIGKHLRFE